MSTRASGQTTGLGMDLGMGMVAVVPVRAGVLPAGGDEAVAEAGGQALLVGDGLDVAAAALPAAAGPVRGREAGGWRPGAWAAALAGELAGVRVLVLPASPDGRDLAPRLARALGRPLLAGAVLVRPDRVVLARYDGRVAEEVTPEGPFVATLVPGVRGVEPAPAERPRPELQVGPLPLADGDGSADAEVLEVLPPDPATMDLAEAARVVAGGQGLGGAAALAQLGEVAARLGASLGGTRVVTDAGWLPPERQIGTTGVAVDPDLYVAVGISGAVQHTAGLGHPRHVVAVNLDPSCPMMQLADLAVVTDAPALVAALARRLGVPGAAEPDSTPAPARSGEEAG